MSAGVPITDKGSAPASRGVSFNLNGKPVTVDVSPGERLSAVLRDTLDCKGTKIGCNAGDCGACSVLLDDKVVCACMVPAGRLNGVEVVTIEGLAARAPLVAGLQRAFHVYGAAQCGICTPGMLISAVALLERKPQPTEDEVEDALGGVLCRCTGYRKIVRAVCKAADFVGTPVPDRAGAAVGSPVPRLDGSAKIAGNEQFGDDVAPSGCLSLRVIRSPHHRARFVLGDIDRFVASTPGVTLVLTAADVPGENTFGVIPAFRDQPVFAENEARYQGEAIAAVVGEPELIEQLDLGEFPVSYTELPPVLDPARAVAIDAPLIHATRPGNVLTGGLVQRGDLAAEFDAAAVVVEDTFTTGFVEHAYIEPEAGYARRVGDRIEVHGCTQAPYMDREEIARVLGIEPEDVRVVPSAVGGGFGSKLDLSFQPYVALAAWRLQQPVRVTYTRPESMLATTKRHPSRIRARVGAGADGKLTAMDFDGVFNTGAYASWGPTVANRVPVHACGPYYLPAYRARSSAIHTHCAPAGAFRGFGVPQSAIAQEALFDRLAEHFDIDRLEFRLRNALDNGMHTVTGQVFTQGVGIRQCLEALRPRWNDVLDEIAEFNRNSSGTLRRGTGIASCWYGCGNTSLPNPSTIRVGINREGRIILFQGAVDIGQGSNTVISQICADALGLDLGLFELVSADTDRSPDAGKTSASRQTFVSGKAAYLAGKNLRANLLARLGVGDDADLELLGARLSARREGDEIALDLATLPADDEGLVVIGEGTFDPPTKPLDDNGQGEPYATFGFGAQLAVTEVDVELGTVRVIEICAAHDVGRTINPVLAEGQIEGGIAQGIGMALMEEFVPGRSANLHDYLIPTIGDVPDIGITLIEEPDVHGPFGAKGLGEHVLIPTAPAILNAITHATGARVRNLPATPERVLNAIREAT